MKSIVLTVSMLAMAASAGAQQPAIDHSHMHDMQAAPAQASPAQAPAAPQAPATGQPPAAPGGGPRRPADRRAVERRHSAGHRRTRGTGAEGIEPPRRMGRREDGRRRRAQELGGLSRARAEGGRRPGDPRHPRHVRHGPRDGRSARAGRLHRDRSGLPLGEGSERRRHRHARAGCGQDDPDADAGRRQRAPERGDGVRQEAARLERQDRRDRLLLGRRPQLRLCRGPARR